eukprot:3291917-Rhodomonas_salina.1
MLAERSAEQRRRGRMLAERSAEQRRQRIAPRAQRRRRGRAPQAAARAPQQGRAQGRLADQG